MIAVVVGIAALTAALLGAMFRRELIEARVRGLEQLGWLHGSVDSARRAATIAMWIVTALFVVIGVAFIAVGIPALA
jgi:hypothetical protein